MKPVLLFSVVMLLLSVTGFIAGQKVFKPIEQQLPQRKNLQEIRSMNESDRMRYYESIYNDIKFSFISFDLANGLTFADIRAIRSNFSRVFYLLVGCLLLLRFLKKPKA
ncbi:MAG: hypothetical protein WCA08_08565 [Desulfoferrobacter sp.]